MQSPYEVTLHIPELSPGRLTPAEHVAAEVQFAKILERVCEATNGVRATIADSDAKHEAWVLHEDIDDEEPVWDWDRAVIVANQQARQELALPKEAYFSVRVTLPESPFEYSADVPF